jgi:hypothetical protein
MIAEHVQPIDRVKSEKAFERGISMTNIRRIVATDVVECGRILHAAFSAIAEQHNCPPDFPSVDVAIGVASMLIGHPGFYGVVAEQDGRILGSNFIDLRSIIAGMGQSRSTPRRRTGVSGGA